MFVRIFLNVCILIKFNQPVVVFNANKYTIILWMLVVFTYLLLSTEVRGFNCFSVHRLLLLLLELLQ